VGRVDLGRSFYQELHHFPTPGGPPAAPDKRSDGKRLLDVP
jgi:hypothetical protein